MKIKNSHVFCRVALKIGLISILMVSTVRADVDSSLNN